MINPGLLITSFVLILEQEKKKKKQQLSYKIFDSLQMIVMIFMQIFLNYSKSQVLVKWNAHNTYITKLL